MKLVKVTQNLGGFPSPDLLSCDNHPILEGVHPLPTSAKVFYNSVLSSNGDIFEDYPIVRKSFRKVYWAIF